MIELTSELEAQKQRYAEMFDRSLRIMAMQDDAAEAMALGIEAHLKGHIKEVPELAAPLAAWRKIRPTPGLIQ